MAKRYLPYNVDQRLLLPPDMRDWLSEGHLALFMMDLVSELDLSAIERVYEAKDARGRAGYHPAMMVALLLYAYCVGKPSSRKIERATYEDVGFRVLTGDQHPDHDSIADFRKRHLEALAGFLQGYNAQIAVDSAAQIIVATLVVQAPNDVQRLVPMAEAIVANVGQLATTTSADTGYFSAQNVTAPALETTTLLVPPTRQKHGSEPLEAPPPGPPPGQEASAAERMRYKLSSAEGRGLYKQRKAIVEPVFGQLKEVRGFRRLLLRGLTAARAEFNLIALTHNVLKLFRASARPAMA